MCAHGQLCIDSMKKTRLAEKRRTELTQGKRTMSGVMNGLWLLGGFGQGTEPGFLCSGKMQQSAVVWCGKESRRNE